MAIEVTVAGNTFVIPERGEDPDWSGDFTDWVQSITNAVNTLFGSGDILTTTTSIATNITTPSNVNGLIFSPSIVRAANVTYSIYRKDDNDQYGYSATGTILLSYDNNAPSGSKWTLAQNEVGVSGVVFSILDSGQIQYISSNLSGTNYTGTLKFNAKTLSQ